MKRQAKITTKRITVSAAKSRDGHLFDTQYIVTGMEWDGLRCDDKIRILYLFDI